MRNHSVIMVYSLFRAHLRNGAVIKEPSYLRSRRPFYLFELSTFAKLNLTMEQDTNTQQFKRIGFVYNPNAGTLKYINNCKARETVRKNLMNILALY
jgi:hypothetical protein